MPNHSHPSPGVAMSLPPAAQKLLSGVTRRTKIRLLQGAAPLLLLIVVASMLQHFRAAAVTQHDSEVCYGHLKQISAALRKYRSEHKGRLPRALVSTEFVPAADTLYPRYIQSMDVFICPTGVKNNADRGEVLPMLETVYDYQLTFWLRDLPGDIFKSKEFYGQIVPERGKDIHLVQCPARPGNLKSWVIMWDGSIQEKPWLHDTSFGRYKRDATMRKVVARIRARGGILAPGMGFNPKTDLHTDPR